MVIITFIYSLIGTPLGYIMWVLYLAVQNFGVAVILFTLVVKLASFPLTLKQQKNMAVSQLFTPRVQEIQKKYKHNQPKFQEEMAKLQKEGYNPMGGCGPLILVFIILFGVIDVVYKPMTHLEHFEWEEEGSIAKIKEMGLQTDYTSIISASEDDYNLILEYIDSENDDIIKISEENPQIVKDSKWKLEKKYGITNAEREKIGEFIHEKLRASAFLTGKESRLSSPVKSEINAVTTAYSALQGELHAVQAFANNREAFQNSKINTVLYEKLEKLQSRMIFLGIDLGRKPIMAFDPIILIPILSLIFSAAQIYISQRIQKLSMPDMPMAGGSATKTMFFIMPFFSLFLAFTVPAGAGFYWAISYLIGIAQSIIMYKFWHPEKMREEAKQKMKEKSAVYNTTATVTDIDENGEEVERSERLSEMSGKEQKEYYRKKLEQARLEDLKKYGDVDIPEDSELESDKKD